MNRVLVLIKNSIKIMWVRHHFIIPPRCLKRYIISFYNKLFNKNEYYNPFIIKEYNEWLLKNQNIIEIKKFKYNPLISVIIPVYNIQKEYLSECLDSILNQSYQNFEICIADDNSSSKETLETLKKYEKLSKKIKVIYRKKNGHISEATNSALSISNGDFIAFMDDDDLLDKNALYFVVEALNNDRKIEIIYTDEDKIDMQGNYCEPHFKSDFSIDSFFGGNYMCHLTVIKKNVINKIGNFYSEYNGAQDFDYFLRATEVAKKVYHIPKILYHWRKIPGSTADNVGNKSYAIENGKKAVENALKRRKINASVEIPIKCTEYVVNYNLLNKPKISVIMLDVNEKIINNNLKELYLKNNYKNIEIIINHKNISLKNKYNNVIFSEKSSISELIKESTGDYLLIIVGKIKLDNPTLIEFMLGYATQELIGVVGPKICNFDKTIKSAGIILNERTIYSNCFSGYFYDSVGFYARLVVPYNYSVLSNRFIMFDKKKYIKVNGFINNKNFDLVNIDFCLKLINLGYRNVLLSNRYIMQKEYKFNKKYEINTSIYSKITKNWDFSDNTYYNENLSREYPFMLELCHNNKKNNMKN